MSEVWGATVNLARERRDDEPPGVPFEFRLPTARTLRDRISSERRSARPHPSSFRERPSFPFRTTIFRPTDMPTTIAIPSHPLLRAHAFTTRFDGAIPDAPAWLLDELRLEAAAPLERSEEVRAAVREMLRLGGYKPTGRGKPASEYLLRAAGDGGLGSINAAVDACNVVSLHSGLPISLIDLDRARAPFRIEVAAEGTSYIFNASGQEIEVSGLLCLFDAEGACANAVKDSQRTKTHPGTISTLSIIWGVRADEARGNAAERWYREIIEKLGGNTEDVVIEEMA